MFRFPDSNTVHLQVSCDWSIDIEHSPLIGPLSAVRHPAVREGRLPGAAVRDGPGLGDREVAARPRLRRRGGRGQDADDGEHDRLRGGAGGHRSG